MSRSFHKRILLVNPPQELKHIMGDAGKFVTRWEPLGLLYIAAVLQQHGYEVHVVDAEADPHTLEEIESVVDAYDPAVVGITCLTPTAPPSIELGKRIRATDPRRKVVMGNVHARVFPETLLRLGACDFVVEGDGEFIMLELVQCLEAGRSHANIAGLSFLDRGHFVRNPPPPLPPDLDVIAKPARQLVRHINYDAGMLNNLSYIRPEGTVSRQMLTSRGCVYACKFCVVHQERRFRVHSVDRVIDEMLDLQNNYNCGFVFFNDPIFVANKPRVHAICEAMQKRGVKIPWGCEGHVLCVDRDLLTAMKRAGCVQIAYGIESGSQRILNEIAKQTKLENVHKAIRLTKDVGIPATGLFILGLPGETRDEMHQTIDLALSLPLDFAQFSMFVPYPGSEHFERLRAEGIIDTGVRADGSVDYDVWQRYSPYVGYGEVGNSIYLPPGMTFDDIFSLQRKAMRRFFFRPRQILQNAKRIRPSNLLDVVRAAKTIFFKQSRPKTTATAQRVVPLAIPEPLSKPAATIPLMPVGEPTGASTPVPLPVLNAPTAP